MGRRAKAKRESKRENVQVFRPQLRSGPNWPLLALSILGILLAAYLSWTEWTGTSVKGCSVGSSCDIVLSSPWAKLFGLPTAFWGMLAYLVLAGLGLIRMAAVYWVV